MVRTDTVPRPKASAEPAAPAPSEAPRDLLLEGRAAQPDALAALEPVLGLPRLGRAGPLAYGALANVLDESAPTDIAIVLEGISLRLQPKVWSFVSSGVTSYDEAAAELARLDDRDELGADRIGVSYDGRGGPCVLYRVASGPAARLVCVAPEGRALFGGYYDGLDRRELSAAHRQLDRVAPYMVRRLADEPVEPGQAWLRVPMAKLAARHGGLLKAARPWILHGVGGGGDAAARWLSAIVPSVFDEALAVGGVTRDVTLRVGREGEGYRVSAEAVITDRAPWSAQVVAEVARNAGVPEAFRRLPADSGVALFTARVPERRAKQIDRGLEGWIRQATGASPPTVDVMAAVVGLDDAMVYAHGDVLDHDAGDDLEGGERLRRVMLSVWGWHLFGFHGSAPSYEPRLDAGRQAYNSGDLRALVYQQLPRLCRGLPAITKRPAGGKLPAGSVLYEMAIPARLFDDCWLEHRTANPTPAKNAALVVLMVPDGERTWIGVSPDEADLRARIRRALAGQAGTLGAIPALAQPGTIAGGRVTLRGMAALHRFVDQYESWSTRRERFEGLPHRGASPIFLALRAFDDETLRVEGEAIFDDDVRVDIAGTAPGALVP